MCVDLDPANGSRYPDVKLRPFDSVHQSRWNHPLGSLSVGSPNPSFAGLDTNLPATAGETVPQIGGFAVPFYRVRLKNGIDEPKRIYSANDGDQALLYWSGHLSLEEASQRLGMSVDQYRDMFIIEETSSPSTSR